MAANKDEVIILRISNEDRLRIQEKMKEMEIRNMSAYIRKMALDGYCINLDLESIRELISQLSRCGNNLNQYARRANEDGSIYAADIRDLQERFDGIRRDCKQILADLASVR